jgi:DNA-binding PadR family transcriptional regulator
MQDQMQQAKAFLPLTEATYLILVSLAEPRHGYGIMQAVAVASDNGNKLGPGTLYGALNKLLEQNLIVRAGECETGGERRKMYALTPLGRTVVELESDRLESLARMGRRILEAAGAKPGVER